MLGCSSFPLALRVYPCQLDRKWLKESTAHQKTWGPEGSSGRGWLSNLKKKRKKKVFFFFPLWKTKLKWGRRAETRILALRTWFASLPSNLTWSFCRKVSGLLLLASCTTGSWVYTWIAFFSPPWAFRGQAAPELGNRPCCDCGGFLCPVQVRDSSTFSFLKAQGSFFRINATGSQSPQWLRTLKSSLFLGVGQDQGIQAEERGKIRQWEGKEPC